jgi:6-pyruvoyltetrahydropterin/6-carboxytetrahydropterin synthase
MPKARTFMHEVYKEAWISSAHRLRDYKGPCENLHGHNWHVRVFVGATELDATGMVIDFKLLKHAMREVCDRLDHTYLNELPPFDEINPTAENICRHIFEEVDQRINDGRVRVTRAMVWETEGSCAVVTDPALMLVPMEI